MFTTSLHSRNPCAPGDACTDVEWNWMAASSLLHWLCRFAAAEQDSRHYMAGGVGSADDMREACKAALRHAQRCNAFIAESAAQQALLHAWQAVVEIAFTLRYIALWITTLASLFTGLDLCRNMTRYDMLGERSLSHTEDAATEEASPSQLLQELLQSTLQAADLILATKGGSQLAPVLAQVCSFTSDRRITAA